jgi:predicted amino acid dehydrogenase
MSDALAVAIAAVAGSLPTGYLTARRLRDVDIRRLSPHNLGLGTVADVAGIPTLVLVTVLDIAKGALAVGAAQLLSGADWVLAGSAAAAVIAHVYSPWRLVLPRSPTRLKGVVTALGAAATLAATGAVPTAAVAAALGVAAAAVALPRLRGPRWGYLSLAVVLGTATLPVALAVLGARTPYLVAGLAYALVSLWNHKEHLLRIADGIEPRLDDRLPLPGIRGDEAVAAFLIHPMRVEDVVGQARRFRWLAPLHRRGLVSAGLVRAIGRYVRPMKVDDIYPIVTADGRRARVYLIGVPLMADQIREHPSLAVRRAVEAAELAANLGATVLGLGAFWSVVGNKGLEVQARAPITITNGGAYTAGTVKIAIPQVLQRLRERGVEPSRATAAVVGANGVVGFGICRSIAGHVGRLIMVGTDQERLDRSREVLQRRFPAAVIGATTRNEALRDAHVIFSATSAPGPVIFSEHVRSGCVIFDLGRPPDVDEGVRGVPGVEVVPGGVVRLPGDPRGQIDFGYGPGLVPACLAETVIIALDGCHERASLGDRTKTEHIEYFIERGAAIGFVVQGMRSPSDPALVANA